MSTESTGYPWKFQRIGGLDQVVLESAQDICHLDELDPKLWVALSCPTVGLEFDERTLALLDTDKDGRIRIPDVVDAIKWTCARLNNLDSIINAPDVLPLSAINTETEEGKRLLETAHAILLSRKKTDAQYLTQEDVTKSAKNAADTVFNGDGILPPVPALPEDIQRFIKDALSVIGGVEDAGGLIGINQEIASAFIKSLKSWSEWHGSLGSLTTPLDTDTSEAWDLMESIKDKVNDYFLRSDLASYAPQAQTALNVDEKFLITANHGILENEALAELPLSKIAPDTPLDLTTGLNPIWRLKVERFAELVKPLLSQPGRMTRHDWELIQKTLAPYSDAAALKPGVVQVAVTAPPESSIDNLGEPRIKEILNSNIEQQFDELAYKDSKTPAAAADIAAVEKLVIYHKHLYRLLMNYVSFHDFFDFDRTAAFQAGRLFIDGRCCHLCVPVKDVTKHTGLAEFSELFILYCECTRKLPAANDEPEKITIAAAMTAGNADLLIEGRNGVFVDNHGCDWDATVVKTITKPISLREAVWSPYKRLGRFVTEQVNKWASTKDSSVIGDGLKSIQAASSNAVATAAPAASAGTATTPSKFDIGRSVGIFAAIGLAIGAIGTALASIARALFELQWWQFPLVVLGLFLLISGPSVVMAWLKLRQRTLGPLLEASGWAINGRVKINYFLGNELTSMAELPENSSRNYVDPTKGAKGKYWFAFIFAIVIGAAAMAGWYWYRSSSGASQPVAQAVADDGVSQATESLSTEN